MPHYYDEEAALLGGSNKREPSFEFAHREVRAGFVRKVFGLLTAQLAVTTAVTALFIFNSSVKAYIASNSWPFWTSFGVSFAVMLLLAVSEELRRSHPVNLLLMAAFTLGESVVVGAICASYNAPLVLLAAGITAAVVAGCALFATQSKADLTLSSGALVSLSMALLSGILINLFIQVKWMYVAICVVGVVLFTMYLIFDIQMLMGGHKYAISPDEFVFASINLYLDIINIFLYILQLLSQNRD